MGLQEVWEFPLRIFWSVEFADSSHSDTKYKYGVILDYLMDGLREDTHGLL